MASFHYDDLRYEARRKNDWKFLDLLDRGWELNVEKQVEKALDTGVVEGIHDRDFSRDLTEYVKGRKSSMNVTATIKEIAMDKQMVAKELIKIAKELIAAETFKCPDCGTKVLENTGYCLKCKDKVKKD